MRSFIESLLGLLMILFVLFAFVSRTKWRYSECKKVGHSTLYCVVNSGGR